MRSELTVDFPLTSWQPLGSFDDSLANDNRHVWMAIVNKIRIKELILEFDISKRLSFH